MDSLIIGSNHTAALERTYCKYLNEAGIVSEIFPAQQLFLAYYKKSLLNKLIFRSGISGIHQRINRAIKERIEKTNPSWIWVFKGMEIMPSTILWIKEKGIKIINFNPDNPFIFSGRGSGNLNVTQSITLFDHYFTYDHEVLNQLCQKKVTASLLPFGYDYDPVTVSRFRSEIQEVNKACFIGMPDKFRVAFIRQLIDAGIPVDCYGSGWNKFIDPSKAGVFPAKFGDDFLRILCTYRVQLNYMRPHNLRSHNMRTFEIAGAGAIQLAPRTDDHQKYFVENSEIFLFDDVNDCIQKIKGLLSLRAGEAAILKDKVRNRCELERYSYRDRTGEVIAEVKSLE